MSLRAALLARRRGVVAGRAVRVGRGVRVELAPGARLRLGDGCVLGPGTRVVVRGGTVSIGAGAELGDGCRLVAHAGITIGPRCILGPQVAVLDADESHDDPETPIRLQPLRVEPVEIGAGAVLGPGAAVLPGAIVAPGARLGARTVTTGPARAGMRS